MTELEEYLLRNPDRKGPVQGLSDISKMTKVELCIYVMTLYAGAAVNLYGLESVSELARMANRYRREASGVYVLPVDLQESDVVLLLAKNTRLDHYLKLEKIDGVFYTIHLDLDLKEARGTLEDRKKYQRKHLDLTEFLKYAGIGELELWQWMEEHDADSLDEFMDGDWTNAQALEILKGVEFRDKGTLDDLRRIVSGIRRWDLYGRTKGEAES